MRCLLGTASSPPRPLARQAGLADRVRSEVAPADAFPGRDYDLISYFDVLHDLGHPVPAAG
ncbi:hypothetical protein [Kitasatospora sp. NPDC001683]